MMRRITAQSLMIGLALTTLLASVGCNSFFGFVHRDTTARTGNPADLPDAGSLVKFLNDNAQKVQGLQAVNIDIDCRGDNQVIGLTGKLACQKPRDFRLKAALAGKDFVDIGSNSEEFWFWVKQGDVPYVYHCKHSELGRAAQQLPIPFQPELILAALGVGEFDPAKTYERKVNPDTIELIEHVKSPQGKDQLVVVVFNRAPDTQGKPRIAAYMLKDAETGKDICQAIVQSTYPVGPNTNNAIIPYRVEVNWPDQKVRMKLTLGTGMQVRNFTQQESARLFNRADLGPRPSFDLATGQRDNPPGVGQAPEVQRAGMPPR
jgi:hypothetical protein